MRCYWARICTLLREVFPYLVVRIDEKLCRNPVEETLHSLPERLAVDYIHVQIASGIWRSSDYSSTCCDSQHVESVQQV